MAKEVGHQQHANLQEVEGNVPLGPHDLLDSAVVLYDQLLDLFALLGLAQADAGLVDPQHD